MAVRENRSVRVEDWNGNVYHFGSSSGVGGIIIDSLDAGMDPSTPPYTEGSHTSDPYANGGNAIVLTSGDSRKKLFVANISELPFGNVSINMRIKSTMSESITEILEVNTYYVDISSGSPIVKSINSEKFVANDFKPNEYVNISSISGYGGVDTGETMLQIEIVALPGTGASFYFDQMAVAMEMAYQSQKDRITVDSDTNTIIVTQKNRIDVEDTTMIVP